MSTDSQRLNAEEQQIAKLIASQLSAPVADVASAIMATERRTNLVDVPGLTLQICEAYLELMKTSWEEAERGQDWNLLHGAAEACQAKSAASF